MARKRTAAAPEAEAPKAIRFVAPFDHVTVARTVAYRAGDVVTDPAKALIEAAGAKAEPVTTEEAPEEIE